MQQTQVSPVLVSLSDLVRLDATDIAGVENVMRPLDEKHVKNLMGALESVAVEDWPILEATEIDGVGVVVLDGYHRWSAALQMKQPDTDVAIDALPVYIRSYPSDLAILDAAFQFNTKHGKPLDSNSRTKYGVFLYFSLLGTSEEQSERQVAKRVGISNVTLNAAIKKEKSKRAKVAKESATEVTTEATTEATEATEGATPTTKLFKSFAGIVRQIGENYQEVTDSDLATIIAEAMYVNKPKDTDVNDLTRLGKLLTQASKKLGKMQATPDKK